MQSRGRLWYDDFWKIVFVELHLGIQPQCLERHTSGWRQWLLAGHARCLNRLQPTAFPPAKKLEARSLFFRELVRRVVLLHRAGTGNSENVVQMLMKAHPGAPPHWGVHQYFLRGCMASGTIARLDSQPLQLARNAVNNDTNEHLEATARPQELIRKQWLLQTARLPSFGSAAAQQAWKVTNRTGTANRNRFNAGLGPANREPAEPHRQLGAEVAQNGFAQIVDGSRFFTSRASWVRGPHKGLI